MVRFTDATLVSVRTMEWVRIVETFCGTFALCRTKGPGEVPS